MLVHVLEKFPFSSGGSSSTPSPSFAIVSFSGRRATLRTPQGKRPRRRRSTSPGSTDRSTSTSWPFLSSQEERRRRRSSQGASLASPARRTSRPAEGPYRYDSTSWSNSIKIFPNPDFFRIPQKVTRGESIFMFCCHIIRAPPLITLVRTFPRCSMSPLRTPRRGTRSTFTRTPGDSPPVASES